MILAIDPGNVQSAWVVIGNIYEPYVFGIEENKELLRRIKESAELPRKIAIEMVASYGMAVGATVFDTCVWIGRFQEASEELDRNVNLIFRKDVKMNLCGNTKAKDTNIRQALIDRFGVVGTKKDPGWFYGFKKDIWAAYAVGVTYLDSLMSAVFNSPQGEMKGVQNEL